MLLNLDCQLILILGYDCIDRIIQWPASLVCISTGPVQSRAWPLAAGGTLDGDRLAEVQSEAQTLDLLIVYIKYLIISIICAIMVRYEVKNNE